MDRLIVSGARAESGRWKPWEHICTPEEIKAVLDSAQAKAEDSGRMGKPAAPDYLDGARYIFDTAFGPRERPLDGDIRIFSIQTGESVMAEDEQEMRCFLPK